MQILRFLWVLNKQNCFLFARQARDDRLYTVCNAALVHQREQTGLPLGVVSENAIKIYI
jgi:hypothetical protein